MLFCKIKGKKGFWATSPYFSGLRMYFYRLSYLIWSNGCTLYLKHVSLEFSVYHWLSSFPNGLKHLCSLELVSILGVTLWKVVMKCKLTMFFDFLSLFLKLFIFEFAKFYLTKYQICNQLNFFSGCLYLQDSCF